MLDSLSTLAQRLAALDPAAVLGRDSAGPYTQRRFMRRLAAWQALLLRHGGNSFALYLDDALEFAAALLGAWQAGKTVWLGADTLAASCEALALRVDGFLGQFPAQWSPLVAADDAPAVATMPMAPRLVLDASFAALVVFTSGSTGAAQAIPKKLSQLGSEIAALETLFGALADGAEVLATVSHQHIYGLLFKVLWPLACGRPMLVHSVNFPEQLAPLLAARPCVLVASPAHLKRLPEQLAWEGARRQLRAVFSSGGPLAPEDGQAVGTLLGRVPLEVYGSSETGGIAWRQRGAQLAGDGAWSAFPGVAWRIAGSESEGALEVRSAHLADDGWLRLADRAQPAGQCFLLLGRGDRIVKIEEKRISLDAIEAALLATSLVREARVLACAPDAARRQLLAAFVVPSDAGRAVSGAGGKLALNRALLAALHGRVDALALPRRWRYLERLPQDAQGKVTQARLLALLEPGAVETETETETEIGAPGRPREPLLRVLEHETRQVVLELIAPAALLYFDGHFPGTPILPGVVQLDWAIGQARRYFAPAGQFRAVHALKFQQVIRPDSPVRLELLHDAGKHSVQFRYFSDAGQHASGRIVFDADAPQP